MYRLSVERLEAEVPFACKWVIDAPTEQSQVSLQALQNSVDFRAWLATPHNPKVVPYLKGESERIELKFSEKRGDVHSFLKAHGPELSGQSCYGIQQAIKMNEPVFKFGFHYNGQDYDLARISIIGTLDILKGPEGWLFLNNDSNGSVDQYQGKRLLSWPLRVAWHWYFRTLVKLSKRARLPTVFLIAPSKEMVVSEFYPHQKGQNSPVQQVCGIARSHGQPLVYPESLLRVMEPRSFRKGDTHWALAGARAAWLDCVAKLGLPLEPLKTLFNSDQYEERPHLGDLGNKVYPPIRTPELVLLGYSYRQHVIFDNHLPNFGRVLVTHNSEAVFKKRLLVFGSSSCYSMLHYVVRSFAEVVFVHSAGNVDASFTRLVEPDYLVLQSNGRFLVKPASFRYRVVDDVQAKWQRLSPKEQAYIQEQANRYPLERLPEWLAPIVKLVSAADHDA
ncbi:hypothetical protein [Reinekea blandensis]|uniref:AlgX/AlgJ SGNH hydrolase-like domain-containing protein n=1 Tax=Reinekea blandensis MED297 TaxID=314283 RepID=A4BIY9_9GAMM|nr:hypothetical protein [Reinekea blandensis]EAR07922.1 hypothetical protein MED297_15370 [Reinekea sp. MED297] [Reinekea blandensis MED297]